MELESELSLLEVSESELEFDYQRMLVSELESVPKFSDSPALVNVEPFKQITFAQLKDFREA